MTPTLSRRHFGGSLLALGAAAGFTVPALGAREAYRDPTLPIDQRVEDLLRRMTLEEKVAQMMGVWQEKDKIQDGKGAFSARVAKKNFPHGIGQISRPGDRVGTKDKSGEPIAAGAKANVINREGREAAEYANAAQKWAVEQTRLGIPLLLHEEALHGFVGRGATSFPQSIALASSWDPAMVERIFSVAAREMRLRGANLALAPVVDIARDPRWGRIEETYGEDPWLVGEMGMAAIRGFQGTTLPLARDKVFVTLKHLTGHGQPESGTNVGPAQISERTLRENFFPPFERAIRTLPVRAVMASYNEIDGLPSHINKWLLDDVLRKEWGFQGAVVSDYFAIRELKTVHAMIDNLEEGAVRALEAGVDVELPDGETFPALPALVKAGKVPEARIDEAVRRVLRMKFEAGLFENPYVDAKVADAQTATPDALALAREAAARCIILLKNENNLLPLNAAGTGTLLVVGTHARDTPIGGYSEVPREVVSVLDGVRAAAGPALKVDYAEGVRLTEARIWEADEVVPVSDAINDKLIAEAVAKAASADTILLVLGENEQLSREAWAKTHLGDRASLELFGRQNDLAEALFKLGKPVVVLLLNGRPLAVNMVAEKAGALLEGWYLGQQTGHGVADVLFGRVSPGGKLPVTVPRDVGQLPLFYNAKPSARRGYLFDDVTPLFPFGFGLTYSSFTLDAPRLSKPAIGVDEQVQISATLRNNGNRRADQVVQLYLRDQAASVTRPLIELKRFQRVALDAGAATTVTFTLGPDDFAIWDAAMKKRVEPGRFTLSLGFDSVDLQGVDLQVG
ncbi:glycoside hydrolase family 3 N-terminal domain-containing protein [Niveispirillum irakense]|uniref:glycoside hydrolase family 3 N-terminal domain-containing protein n=1 Tax=Niveispirillum irakense TaxID=34011 RepID=UPI000410EA4A|nr:glycoside hydrolase family 3 N-terminal domain-containing protein [Niveispirillum irakense]